MSVSVERIAFCGEPAVLAQNEALAVTLVPGWGGNLISMRDKRRDVELLRVPTSEDEYLAEPILYGTPVLFPPNRIADGTFVFQGTEYRFHINEPADHNHSHGLVFGERWELDAAECEGDGILLRVRFDSAAHPAVLAQFPHRFGIELAYRLTDNVLMQETAITNRDDRAFPWGIGFHTTFRFPFRSGDDLANCTFALHADRQWELNERFLPTGRLFDIPFREEMRRGMSLVNRPLDDVFVAAGEGDGDNEAVLYDGNIGLKIIYCCDRRFGHWVVYNDDARQGYLCPEPYTWVTNAPNLPLPETVTGLRVLQPGETAVVRTKLTIEG